MYPDRYPSSKVGISWIVLILGIMLGIGAGLLYTWEIDPVIERNTAPWQLGAHGREDYVVAVALSYAYNHDINLAFNRLRALRPNQNVWDMVAEIACERHRTVQVKTNSDVIVMRALEQLYRSQGASGCADGQYPTPAPVSFITPTPSITPTFTLTPPATKTPTPTMPTSTPFEEILSPTAPPTGNFVAVYDSFCDATLKGVIEVRVFDLDGQGIPGVAVQTVSENGRKETFYTGLKPGREPGYADFEMSSGISYTVTIPGLVSAPPILEATPCEATANGESVSSLTSYRVNFHQRRGG